MEYALLKDVTQESHRWRVRVRATRFSEYVDDGSPKKVLRLDFVLLDEQVSLPLYITSLLTHHSLRTNYLWLS